MNKTPPSFAEYPALYRTHSNTVTTDIQGNPIPQSDEKDRLRHLLVPGDKYLYYDLKREKEEMGFKWRFVVIYPKGEGYSMSEWILADRLTPYYP